MERKDLAKYELPDVPGVYLFKQGRKVLYVGKATSLRDRVRSYFDDDLIATRGPRIVDMVTMATGLSHEPTPTVLEALVREAALIRKYRPLANVEGKDDKTFLYAVITKEEIPRVLAVRGKDIDFKMKRLLGQGAEGVRYRNIYGPFTSGPQLREAFRLIRRIFPFFDTQKPVDAVGKHHKAGLEFYRQIGQYPRPGRAGAFDRKEYLRSIRRVELFLSGRTKELRKMLEREMKHAAIDERFEDAATARRQLFALDHVQDVSLIKDEATHPSISSVGGNKGWRIEAYDTAHISGTNAIAVMTVVEDGRPNKKEYRTFRIRGKFRRRTSEFWRMNDDIASLKEVLSRRLDHPEWPLPRAIVVDGGKTQKKAAESVLADFSIQIPVVAIVKDEKHRPREVLPAGRQGSVIRGTGISVHDAILANAEAHRFALLRHRRARARSLRS